MRQVSVKQKERNKEKAQETEGLHKLFKQIWDEQEDESGYCYCFETGRAMHGSAFRSNTCCYDHVLEKNEKAYPQYTKTRENIIIVHPDVHTMKGRDIDKCPKIKEYRNKLLTLHEEGKL
jgi:hypothetical protein